MLEIKKMSELDSLSSFEIDNYKCNLENELKEMISNHEILEQEKLDLQRQILELQLRKKSIEASISRSKSNMNILRIEIRTATSKFWAVKNERR